MPSTPPSQPDHNLEQVELSPELLERANLNLQILSRDEKWYTNFSVTLAKKIQEAEKVFEIEVMFFADLESVFSKEQTVIVDVPKLLADLTDRMNESLRTVPPKKCDFMTLKEHNERSVKNIKVLYKWLLRRIFGRNIGRRAEAAVDNFGNNITQFHHNLTPAEILDTLRGTTIFEELISREPDAESAEMETRKFQFLARIAQKNIRELPVDRELQDLFLYSITGILERITLKGYVALAAKGEDHTKGNISSGDERDVEQQATQITKRVTKNWNEFRKEIIALPAINLQNLHKKIIEYYTGQITLHQREMAGEEENTRMLHRPMIAGIGLLLEHLRNMSPEALVHTIPHDTYIKLIENLPDPASTTDDAPNSATSSIQTEISTAAAGELPAPSATPSAQGIELAPELVERAKMNFYELAKDPQWVIDFLAALQQPIMRLTNGLTNKFHQQIGDHLTQADLHQDHINKFRDLQNKIGSELLIPGGLTFENCINIERKRIVQVASAQKLVAQATFGRKDRKVIGNIIDNTSQQLLASIGQIDMPRVLKWLRGTPYFDELIGPEPDRESMLKEVARIECIRQQSKKNIRGLPGGKPLQDALICSFAQRFERQTIRYFDEQSLKASGLYIKSSDNETTMIVPEEEAKKWPALKAKLEAGGPALIEKLKTCENLNLQTIKNALIADYTNRFNELSGPGYRMTGNKHSVFESIKNGLETSIGHLNKMSENDLFDLIEPTIIKEMAFEMEKAPEHAQALPELPPPAAPAPTRAETPEPSGTPSKELALTPEVINRAKTNLQILARDPQWASEFLKALSQLGTSLTGKTIDKIGEKIMNHVAQMGVPNATLNRLLDVAQKLEADKVEIPAGLTLERFIGLERIKIMRSCSVMKIVVEITLGRKGRKKLEYLINLFIQQALGCTRKMDMPAILKWLKDTPMFDELTGVELNTESNLKEREQIEDIREKAKKNFRELPGGKTLQDEAVCSLMNTFERQIIKYFAEITFNSCGHQTKDADGSLFIELPKEEHAKWSVFENKIITSFNALVEKLKGSEKLNLQTIKKAMIAHYTELQKEPSGFQVRTSAKKPNAFELKKIALETSIELLNGMSENDLFDLIKGTIIGKMMSGYGNSSENTADPANDGTTSDQLIDMSPDVIPVETVPSEPADLSEKEKMYLQEMIGDFFHMAPEHATKSADEILELIKTQDLIAGWTADINNVYRNDAIAVTSDTVEIFVRDHLLRIPETKPPEEKPLQFEIPENLKNRIMKSLINWEKILRFRNEGRKKLYQKDVETYAPHQQFGDKLMESLCSLLTDQVHLRISSLTQIESLVEAVEIINGQFTGEYEKSGWNYKTVALDFEPVLLALTSNQVAQSPDQQILALRDLLREKESAVGESEAKLQKFADQADQLEEIKAKILGHREEEQTLESRAAEFAKVYAKARKNLVEYFERVCINIAERNPSTKEKLLDAEKDLETSLDKTNKEIAHIRGLIAQAEAGLQKSPEIAKEEKEHEQKIAEQKASIRELNDDLLNLYQQYANRYF